MKAAGDDFQTKRRDPKGEVLHLVILLHLTTMHRERTHLDELSATGFPDLVGEFVCCWGVWRNWRGGGAQQHPERCGGAGVPDLERR
jgi:hypothetical protein